MVAAQFSNALWMNDVFQAVYGKMVVMTSMQPVAPPTTVSWPAVSMIWRRIFAPVQPAQARWPPARRSSFWVNCLRLTAMSCLPS
jgi:hypothetical protein